MTNEPDLHFLDLVHPMEFVGRADHDVDAQLERLGMRQATLEFRIGVVEQLMRASWRCNLRMFYVLTFGLVPDDYLEQLWHLISTPGQYEAHESATVLRNFRVDGDEPETAAHRQRWWEAVQTIVSADTTLREAVVVDLLRGLASPER